MCGDFVYETLVWIFYVAEKKLKKLCVNSAHKTKFSYDTAI